MNKTSGTFCIIRDFVEKLLVKNPDKRLASKVKIFYIYCKRGIWSTQFYLDYRAVREGLMKKTREPQVRGTEAHPPSPSQHGKRVIRAPLKAAQEA